MYKKLGFIALDFSKIMYFFFAIEVPRCSHLETMTEYIYENGMLDSVL